MRRCAILPALLCVLILMALPIVAHAQSDAALAAGQEMEQQLPPQLGQQVEAGRVGVSAVGRAGERQTREQIMGVTQPLGRINSRINSRLTLRVRNRIDRNYAPDISAASTFQAVNEEMKISSRGLTR